MSTKNQKTDCTAPKGTYSRFSLYVSYVLECLFIRSTMIPDHKNSGLKLICGLEDFSVSPDSLKIIE